MVNPRSALYLLVTIVLASAIEAEAFWQRRQPAIKPRRFAYASLLCDDVMIDATKVLIHSLKRTGTPYPILLLTLPQVTQTADLVHLGAELHPISALDYPFRVSAEKTAINKMCRYSKLHIWKFVDYERIVFVDVDTLIVQNIDDVFTYPQFSAVRDAGDTFNTGLFVLEPSVRTYRHMLDVYFTAPSYNQGDQGFLNWYFRNSTKVALPVMYNTVCKHKSNARWPEMRRQARMLHYTSETKPWTFFSGSHKFWRQNFDAASFYLWARQFRQVLQDLELDGHDPMHPWHNANRVQALCDAAYNQLEENNNAKRRSPAPERPLISVVIHGWKSLESLEDTIYFYRRLLGPRSVRQVLVYWGPRRGLVPPVLGKYKYARQPPVIVVRHRYESANNLWNPLPVHQVNQPVLFVDDHNFLDADRLDLALDIWTHSPLQLVGFFPRYHHRQVLNATLDPSMSSDTASLSESPKPTAPVAEFNATSQTLHHRLTYNLTSAKRPHPYSLVSPSLLLVSSDHLFTYTCLLPERIHRHVDDHGESIRWGGADLALNLLTQGMANVKPIVLKNAFHDVEKEQFAVVDGYAAAKGHLLMDLLRLFAPTNQLTKDRDFLQLNPAIVGPYHKVPFRKRSIKRWNN